MKGFHHRRQARMLANMNEAMKAATQGDARFQFARISGDEAERIGYSNYSYWGSTLRVFLKNRVALSLLILLTLLLSFTFIQPHLPGQYGANTINNNPLTGMQLSNIPPSLSTVAKRLPENARLTVQDRHGDWYVASNTVFSVQKRTSFSVIEYTPEWSKIEFGGQTGYVENTNVKLPEDPTATPYEAMSNFKLSAFDDPANLGNDGSLFVHKDDITITDPSTGGATIAREADLRMLPTTSAFWFGTNNIGQDLWSRVWSGTRTSLFIGFMVALVEALIGIFMGVIWGYVRRLDKLMTEVYNVVDNIPTTIVLILFSYVMRPSIRTLIFAMCLTGWLNMARFIRNQIVIIRDRDYNLASRCLGTSTIRIMLRNLLPYLVSVIMLRMALAIPLAIGDEVFITYIGLGLPVSIPSLGNLINEGRQLIASPSLRYQLLFPAAVLSVITISFYIIGNAFADAADPKNHL